MSSPIPQPPPHLESPSLNRNFSGARFFDLVGPLLALVGIYLLFLALIRIWGDPQSAASFASFDNLHNILRQSTVTSMAALGATFIIISAGIDLSVGSAVALSAMAIATLMNLGRPDPLHPDDPTAKILYLSNHPFSWPLFCALAGITVGMLTGLLNGVFITGLRLIPFIATLGTMMIFRGLTEHISVVAVNVDHNWVERLLSVPDLPSWVANSHFKPLFQWLFLAPALWITLAFAVLIALLLKYFRFGRYATAIGSNEQTARLCGIPVTRTKILIYLLGGFFAGMAGIMQIARQHQGSPASNLGLELDVIAACVIGGASLNGGKGSILGTIVGALITTTIANGCSQIPIPHWLPSWIADQGIGLPTSVQKIVTGSIIIIAVALDNLRQRKPK